MDIKQMAQQTWDSRRFEGVSVDVSAVPNSRLSVSVAVRGSVDLPGDLDAIVANIARAFGAGNSLPAEDLSEPSPPASPKSSEPAETSSEPLEDPFAP